jgi:streptomycin 6-kinase
MAAVRVDVRARLNDRAGSWQVALERVEERSGSILGFGSRDGQAVVLKVFTSQEERRAGRVLEAFDGAGMVRLIEHVPDAVLMERVDPATPLSTLCRVDDQNATAILADVIRRLSPVSQTEGIPAVHDWAGAFDRYLCDGDERIPRDLVESARCVYLDLCGTQRGVRLLHGDLHYDNVLYDSTRGWVAVDPKGVVGELAFEVGAALRNPIEVPELFTDPRVIDARVRRFSSELNLDRSRVVAWAFAQAVLAVVWMVEDGEPLAPEHPWLTLARTLQYPSTSGP